MEKIKRIQLIKNRSKNLRRQIRRKRLGMIMEIRIQLGHNVVKMMKITWVAKSSLFSTA